VPAPDASGAWYVFAKGDPDKLGRQPIDSKGAAKIMCMRTAAFILSTLVALPSLAGSEPPAAVGTTGYEKLRLTRVEAPHLEDSNATQFLAVDSKGHPLLLRGDTLEVFRLGADARFDHRLGKLACDLSSDPAYAAALDPKGSTWAVSSSRELALCDFVKEQRPPGLDWTVSSLTYSRTGPLVAVTSLGPHAEAGEPQFRTKVPRVFGLADGRWHPVSWAPVLELKEMPKNPLDVLSAGKAQSDALICAGPKDAIWLASWNAYRLQKLSAAEKPEREIVVGSGNVEWQKLDKQQQDREARNRAAQGSNPLLQAFAVSAVPRGVVRALLCGREGLLYLVVSTDEGLALDRFDPVQNLLERVLLSEATVSSGPMTAALGTDQLWLGGRLAADGLWRISLDDLATAHWTPVKGLKVNGKPLS
jgi:hypothetical protein